MGSRKLLARFDPAGLSIDHGSWRSLALALDYNNFTACMDVETKVMYFGPLAPSPIAGENHYTTIAPAYPCFCAGPRIAPIVHTNAAGGMTGHQRLVLHVLAARGLPPSPENEERFCGFALRFEPPETEGQRARIAFAATSRHLNPGDNGQLEPALLDAVLNYLTGELGKLPVNRMVRKVEARTSAANVTMRVLQSAGVSQPAAAAAAAARGSLLAQLKKKPIP
jgi:hypothetical protein